MYHIEIDVMSYWNFSFYGVEGLCRDTIKLWLVLYSVQHTPALSHINRFTVPCYINVKVLLKKKLDWTIIGGDRIVLRILRLRRTNKFW